jgi:hypothetical protein
MFEDRSSMHLEEVKGAKEREGARQGSETQIYVCALSYAPEAYYWPNGVTLSDKVSK